MSQPPTLSTGAAPAFWCPLCNGVREAPLRDGDAGAGS